LGHQFRLKHVINKTVKTPGSGGVINASYSMNALINNTQWVSGHFHPIFGGTTVIMYFAAAHWAVARLGPAAPQG
jgi:heme/copper-type cytochrome/quinol oxidase subunit 1